MLPFVKYIVNEAYQECILLYREKNVYVFRWTSNLLKMSKLKYMAFGTGLYYTMHL
jgi:hypothetical protein